MATNILMPALSPTMTEGTLARWLKREGDAVKSGDVLAEIETDKATMEVEAVDEGVLTRIVVPDGTAGVAVNATIGVLDGDGTEETAPAAKAPAPAIPTPAIPAPAIPAPAIPAQAAHAADAPALTTLTPGRVFASPLARRLAKQAGIELSAVTGSGPNGRIIRVDIEQFLAKPTAAAPILVAPGPVVPGPVVPGPVVPGPVVPARAVPAPAASVAALTVPGPVAAITAPHTLIPNTTMRRVIAKRLTESHQSVPTFYVTMDIELDALMTLRAQLNARSPKEGGYKLSINDFVVKASAMALRQVPALNASFTEAAIAQYTDVDISVAVSIPDGLITPILRRADTKGLSALSNEMKDLAARAKSGKLKPEEFQGGGFSVSNLGMFGVQSFTAIINPPQAAILAVGAGLPRPVVRDGQLAIATVMTCTLSVDHRVADGAVGAQWMAVFKALLEDPLGLLI